MEDPLCGFAFTPGGYRDMLQGLLRLTDLNRLKAMKRGLPVLFLSGGEDPLGERGAGVHKVAGQHRDAGLTNVTVRLYEGARHELFNETNREQVRQDLTAWLKEALASA